MPVHALKYPPMVSVLKLSVYVCVEVFFVKCSADMLYWVTCRQICNSE